MSATEQRQVGSAPVRQPLGAGTWTLSWSGVRTVAVLELRQRVRSTRWIIVLLIWVLALLALTALVRYAVFASIGPDLSIDEGAAAERAAFEQLARERAGATMFGVIVFLVLSLGALISPALSATSVNGDRTAGVLATLQSTLLSPAEIAVGKLIAAWASALALLTAAAPFIVWAYFEGGTPIGRLLATLVLLALTLLVVCAIGLGFSALAARTSSSAVMTYLTVAMLGVGLPLLFAGTLPLVTTNGRVPVREYGPGSTEIDPLTGEPVDTGPGTCIVQERVVSRVHGERTWWLLALSPYVVVSDAAPRPTSDRGGGDPLTAVRRGVREVRLGPTDAEDWCGDGTAFTYQGRTYRNGRLTQPPAELSPVWPYGLAADLAIGGGFLALTVLRLRAPSAKLPRGTRVA